MLKISIKYVSPIMNLYWEQQLSVSQLTNSSIEDKVISATDNASTSFDYGLGNAIVENPLVDADNGYDAHHDHDHISVSVLRNKGKTSSLNSSHYPEEEGSNLGPSNYHQKYSSMYEKRFKLYWETASDFHSVIVGQ